MDVFNCVAKLNLCQFTPPVICKQKTFTTSIAEVQCVTTIITNLYKKLCTFVTQCCVCLMTNSGITSMGAKDGIKFLPHKHLKLL